MAKRKAPKAKRAPSKRGVNAVTGYSPKSKRYHGPRGGFMPRQMAINARAVAREIAELRFMDEGTLSKDDRKLRHQQFTIQSQARTESYESVFKRHGWLTERHLATQEAADETQLSLGLLPAPHYIRPGVPQPDGRRLVERVWIWGGKGNLKPALPGGILQRMLQRLQQETPEPAVQWVVYDAGHHKPPVGTFQPGTPQDGLTFMAYWRQKPSAKGLPDLARTGAKILTQLVAMTAERTAKANGAGKRSRNKGVRKVQGKRPGKVPRKRGKDDVRRKPSHSRVRGMPGRGKGGGGGAGKRAEKLKPKRK